MAQEYRTTGKPEIETGDAYSTCMTRAKNGIDTVGSNYGGTSDPTGGGTWNADDVGTLWFNRTNELGAGDGLGGALYIYEKTGATPTYEMTDVKLRRIQAVSPTTLLLSGSTEQNVAFTDLDCGGATCSDRAIAVTLQVECQADTPAAGVFLAVRKNGVTTDSLTRRVYPQVSGLTVQQQVKVELDSSQLFEWAVTTGTTFAYRIDILEYEERA